MEAGVGGLHEGAVLGQIEKEFGLTHKEPGQLSPLTLAFIGDGVFDIIIRTLVVELGNAPVSRLHKKTSALVKAPAQAGLLRALLPVLSEEETGMFKRGRNAKSFTSAKNASISDYRIATGLETLMGYLYLSGRMERAVHLVKTGLELLKKGSSEICKGGGKDKTYEI